MRWAPHVTVACLVEREGRFLVVEESTPDGLRINQPAGHLEDGESLVDAMVREALEETAHHVVPEALVGIYRWRHPTHGHTYLRFAFAARIDRVEPGHALDEGIVRALWVTPDELRASADRHRSPLVLTCLEDHLSGRRFPLDLLCDFPLTEEHR